MDCEECGRWTPRKGEEGFPECGDCAQRRGDAPRYAPHVVLYTNPVRPGLYGPFDTQQQASLWLFRELTGMGLEGDTLEELQAAYAETDATGSGGFSATVEPLTPHG